jgi:PKD repeat protein
MKIKFVSSIALVLSGCILINSCKKEGFPVPPASTVPLFSYTVDNDGFAPATVTFTNESILPEAAGSPSYFWNFGDGTSTTESNPFHTFSAPGNYEVKLVVSMSISLEINELTKNIIIKDVNASGIPVFYTDGSLVYSGLLNSGQVVFIPLPIGPFGDSYDLEIDTVLSKLYISDFDMGKIFQCDLDGGNLIEFRTGLLGPDGMAIDYETNLIYWDTDDGIQRADMTNTDVNQVEDFVIGQSNDPEGVSIDPVNRKIFWVNYNGGLWSKNMDGTNEVELLSEPEGGATLVVGDRIFFDQWIESGDIHLKSANLDGSSISTLTTGITRVVFGMGYESENNKIYWGDRNNDKIMRGNLDGSEIETWYESEGSSPRGITFGKKL